MGKLWEDFKAWRRGEKRVSDASRGRVYAKRDKGSTSPGSVRSKATATCEVMVTRKNGEQEFFNVPVSIENLEEN